MQLEPRRNAPLSSGQVWLKWKALEEDARFACVEPWSRACRAWQKSSDHRLRARILERLLLDENQLTGWLAARHDEPTLIRAHRHVMSTRAELESAAIKRTLTAGALRDQRIVANFRSGGSTVFADASDLSRLIAQLDETLETLPNHPFVHAAWLIQAVGAIHPFIDGNGGTIRFLASLALVRASLPPLVLTTLQRNTTYADAFVDADVDPTKLLILIYDTVQEELARALLEDATSAEWTAESESRSDAWIELAGRAWSTAVGIHVEGGNTIETRARFERRGYHVLPRARFERWSCSLPVPLQFEIAISPVRAGDAAWTIATVIASIGDEGALGPLLWNEPVATTFVAAPEEADDVANARFDLWVANRIDQCVRGLAAWM